MRVHFLAQVEILSFVLCEGGVAIYVFLLSFPVRFCALLNELLERSVPIRTLIGTDGFDRDSFSKTALNCFDEQMVTDVQHIGVHLRLRAGLQQQRVACGPPVFEVCTESLLILSACVCNLKITHSPNGTRCAHAFGDINMQLSIYK
jgi:hypothetical protein